MQNRINLISNYRKSDAESAYGLQPAYRQPHGAILIVTLLAMVLLAALVFYVFNVGRHLQQRVETQNAADTAAISAAGWTARSFNTVAMNNVETARLIALVQVLDSIPMSVAFTLEDQRAAREAAESQLRRGVGPDTWLEPALEFAVSELTRHEQMLEPMDVLFNQSGYDVAEMTFYDGPVGRGRLWEAMLALDVLSQATMEQLPYLVQQSASRGAEINLARSGDGGLALPYAPAFQWRRTGFQDFEPPVVRGLLPEDIDDKEFNRGPFDTIFGWRSARTNDIRREIDSGRQIDDDYDSPWSPSDQRQFETVRREVQSYRTVGTFQAMRRIAAQLADEPVDDPPRAAGPLHPSQFGRRVNEISKTKMNYLFEGAGTAATILDPEWITDFNQAESIVADRSRPVAYGQYLTFDFLRIDQGAISGEPQFLEWGIYYPSSNTTAPPGLTPYHPYIWRDQRVEFYIDGLTNDRITYTYLRYYVFAGINVGEQVDIRNPNNFTENDELPAPISFVPDTMSPSEFDRRTKLTMLGVAYQPNAAALWPTGFDGNRPDNYQVAMAQAEVFNNHSWDLWTQMWHAQLTPIDNLDEWVDGMSETDDLAAMPWVDLDVIGSIEDYLDAIAPLGDQLLEH
jgi:hypothetical protein